MAGGGPSSQATTALVLGILGVLCCGLIGIPAILVAKQELQRIDQGLAPVEGRGLAHAGYILGIVGVVLLALWVLGGLAIPLFINS